MKPKIAGEFMGVVEQNLFIEVMKKPNGTGDGLFAKRHQNKSDLAQF